MDQKFDIVLNQNRINLNLLGQARRPSLLEGDNMLRRLFLTFTFVTLALGCSKKASENTTEPGDTAADTSISATPLSFSTQGSDSGSIEGLRTLFFEYDQANITPEGRKVLTDNASWIKNNSKTTMQIEGHCDERGSIEYNLALGERRAKAVKAYLVSLGVDAKRMTIISFGKEKKIADGDTEEAHAKNRRANFVPLSN